MMRAVAAPPALALALALGYAACSSAPPRPRDSADERSSAAATADAGVAAVPAPLVVAVAPEPDDRLGDAVVPRGYHLEIEADPDDDHYRGVIRIEVELLRPSASLWLHGASIAIESAVLERDGQRLPVETLATDIGSMVIGFRFAPQPAGRAVLELGFHNGYRLGEGVFRQREGGVAYVYTDFEPNDARLGFPCFDDPRFKTPWTLALVIDRDLSAFANTAPVEEQLLDGDRKRITFATTPPLPTYLVAFAVGAFETVAIDDAPLPMRIIVPAGLSARTAAAAAMMAPLYRTLSAWIDVPQPFTKIDLVAVPSFNGAMENPGLITVAKHILLPDTPIAAADRRLLAMVIAHELGHLWFGDLVTLPWWDELWLNEGFATWAADSALAIWRPADRTSDTDEIEARRDAMSLDRGSMARAVRAPLAPGQDPRPRFDATAYKKGAAVMHALEGWLGTDAVRAGVQAYLRPLALGTGSTDALIAALAGASGEDLATVRAVLTSLIDRPGVPLVRVTPSCEGGVLRVGLAQERYRPAAPAPAGRGEIADDDDDDGWTLPVCLRWPGSDGARCLLSTAAPSVTELPVTSCPAWVLPNAGADGYYDWTLPDDALVALAAAPLTARERIDTMRDAEALLEAGELDLAALLGAVDGLDDDGDHEVGRAAAAVYLRLAEIWLPDDDDARARLARHLRQRFQPRLTALGTTAIAGEDPADAELRLTLLRLLGEHGDAAKVVAWARKRSAAWLRLRASDPDESATALPIDELLGVALAIAARHGDAELYDGLTAQLSDTPLTDSLTRQRLATALAAFVAPALLERAATELTPRLAGSANWTEVKQLLRRRDPRTRIAAGLVTKVEPLWLLGYADTDDTCDVAELDIMIRLAEPWREIAQMLIGQRESVAACAATRTRVAAAITTAFAGKPAARHKNRR